MQPRNPVNQNSSFEIPRLPFPVFPSRMSVFHSSSKEKLQRRGVDGGNAEEGVGIAEA